MRQDDKDDICPTDGDDSPVGDAADHAAGICLPAGAARSRQASIALGPGERWYVVHAQPHREARAQAHLVGQGFRTFLPRFSKTVRHARRLRTVSAALFPRYLFVGLNLDRDRWRSINGTFGVSNLVMGEDLPIPVPAGIVEALAASCGADGHVQFGNELGVGDEVRVISGPFSDLIGKLVRVDGPERVRVLLQLLNSEVAVSIARNALMSAAST